MSAAVAGPSDERLCFHQVLWMQPLSYHLHFLGVRFDAVF